MFWVMKDACSRHKTPYGLLALKIESHCVWHTSEHLGSLIMCISLQHDIEDPLVDIEVDTVSSRNICYKVAR
jgi:hypothetical protein